MEYILIIIAAVFVSNIVLNQFLGICPFIGVSSKVETAIGMTGAVTFVMVIATLVTYLIYYSVLVPLDIVYMRTITFILVIASLVQLVEIILKKISPPLPGTGHLPTSDHYQLRRTRCCCSGSSERFQPA
jgi:electron transport complex protein RnfA